MGGGGRKGVCGGGMERDGECVWKRREREGKRKCVGGTQINKQTNDSRIKKFHHIQPTQTKAILYTYDNCF